MVVQNIYKKNIYLILIMTVIAMLVLSTAITILYNTAIHEERLRLTESVQSQARLIEAVALYDQRHADQDAFEATLSQIRSAHEQFEGFGQTGEFTLAMREGANIQFLISHRHHDINDYQDDPGKHVHILDEQPTILFDTENAEPMRRALQGKSGTLIGLDYRGATVLAAYEPVAVLNLGVVAKIDLTEIQAPFIQAAWTALGASLFLVLIGSWAFQRITAPMARHIEQSEQLFRETFSNAAIGLAHVAPDGTWLRANQALCNIVGYTEEDLLQLTFQDITHPDDLNVDVQHMAQVLAGELDAHSLEKRYIRKDGSVVSTILTYSLIRDQAGEPDYFISAVEDITELKMAEKKINKSNEELQQVMSFTDTALDAQQDTFFLFEPSTGKPVRWNRAFREVSGYSEDEIASMPAPSSYYSPEDVERAKSFTQEVIEKGSGTIELELLCKYGGKVPTEYRVSAIHDESGKLKYLISIGRDITKRKQAEDELMSLNAKLEQFSFQDGLTGIANRRMFDQMLDIEWGHAQRDRQPLSLIMLDIDFFKQYNDSYGHQQGDACLQQIAQVLNSISQRSIDLVARYGGEEFVILLPQTVTEQAILLGEKCRTKVIELQLQHESSTVCDVVTISLGVSTIMPSVDTQPSNLVKVADEFLYKAKGNGRNRIEHA
jgi:diguanylate cyclase (GGDEF)-like protein/PAS domain S-box-containing protein